MVIVTTTSKNLLVWWDGKSLFGHLLHNTQCCKHLRKNFDLCKLVQINPLKGAV